MYSKSLIVVRFQLSRYLMANDQLDVSTAQCSQYVGSPVGAAEPESVEVNYFRTVPTVPSFSLVSTYLAGPFLFCTLNPWEDCASSL